MAQHMPQHPLGSHGRLDSYTDGPTPMTITGSSTTAQPDQPPPQDTTAQQVFRGITSVNQRLAEHRAASFDPRLTEQAQREKLAEFATSEDAKALPAFAALADQLVAEKQAAYDEQFKSLTPVGDTAAELRAQRTWDRERSKLDALASEGERAAAVRSAIKNCDDPATLAVLIEESPSYLQAKGVETDWLSEVIAEKVPALSQAKVTLDRATGCATALKQASRMLQGAIESGTPLVTLDKIAPAIERLDPDAGKQAAVPQIASREELQRMSGEQVMAAYRDGRLSSLLGNGLLDAQ